MSKLGQVLATIVLTPIVAFGSLIGAGHLLGTLNAPRPAAVTDASKVIESVETEPAMESPELIESDSVMEPTTIQLSAQTAVSDYAHEPELTHDDNISEDNKSESELSLEDVISDDSAIAVIEDSEIKNSQNELSQDKDTMLLYAYAINLYTSFGSSYNGLYDVYIVDDSIHLVVTDERSDVFFERVKASDLQTWLISKSEFVNIERSLYKNMLDVGVNAHFYLTLVYDGDINLPLLSIYDDGYVIVDEVGKEFQ